MNLSPATARRLTGVGMRVLSVLGAAALLFAVGASPASAVYAGKNGRVAYTLYTSAGSDIYSVAANGTGTRRLTFGGTSSHPLRHAGRRFRRAPGDQRRRSPATGLVAHVR